MKIAKRILLAAMGVLALAWPFGYDQVKLSCALSPLACSNAEPVAVLIILGSMIIGGSCLFVAALGNKWQALILGSVLGIVMFGPYFVTTFSRNFHF